MSIAQHISAIRSTLPVGVTLVCVSKFQSSASIMEAYNAGERVFGESRAQELVEKQRNLPPDIEWHFIGHLQQNKVKTILPIVSLIHSADSNSLLHEIEKVATSLNKKVKVLLQVHIAQEEQKFGFTPSELNSLFEDGILQTLPHVQVVGLMGMATFTNDASLIHSEFHMLKTLFDTIKNTHFSNNCNFNTLSMGMSEDYQIAISEGSNMIRVGSSIFGERDYSNNSRL